MSEITVRRANTLLTVPEEQKEDYLLRGYDVVDDRTGAVIEATIPTDVNVLRAQVQELQGKVKALTEENKKLKTELASKDEPVETPEEEKDEDLTPEEEPEEVEPVKDFTPINKRKSNKK